MAQRGLRYSSYIQFSPISPIRGVTNSLIQQISFECLPCIMQGSGSIDQWTDQWSVYQSACVNEQSKLCPSDAYIPGEETAKKQTNQYLWHGVRGMCRESIMRRHLSQNLKDICNLLWGRETGREGVSYLSILKKESSFYFIFWQECGRAGETSFPLFPGLFFFS